MGHFLTFILPCFNYADIIEQSLASIYQQKLNIPFEVICTDDCSTDERTRDILRKWEKLYSNFYAHYHTENKSEGGACNTCIEHSKGDLIFCLDTDNVLVKDSVQDLVDLIDKTGCEGACFHRLKYFIEIDKKYAVQFDENYWTFKAPDNIVDIHHIISTSETPASSGNYLFTRESYNRAGGYSENNCMGSYCFGFKQHATGSRIAVLPNTFYWHRYSKDGMYLTNLKKGTIGKDVWSVVSVYMNIFTEETQKFLKEGENRYNFIGYCNAGKIKIK